MTTIWVGGAADGPLKTLKGHSSLILIGFNRSRNMRGTDQRRIQEIPAKNKKVMNIRSCDQSNTKWQFCDVILRAPLPLCYVLKKKIRLFPVKKI